MNKKIKYYILTISIFILLLILNCNISKATSNTKMCLDYPREINYKTEMYIEGWIMSQEETNLKITIGNYDVTNQVERIKREDVYSAIKGYGDEKTNPTPGFQGTINLSKIPDGTYTLSVQAISKTTGKILEKQEKEISIKKYNTLLHIDYPQINSNQKSSIYLEGWVMSENPGIKIKVFIDGNEVKDEIKRTVRKDVISAIKGYGTEIENPFPGIEANIDISNLKDGVHTIKVQAILSSTGEICSEFVGNINEKKYESQITWDYPRNMEASNYELYVEGWVMSEDKDEEVQVFIDDKDVSNSIKRTERQDVLNAVKGYGGAENNTYPGFMGTINLEEYKDGIHKITLKVISPKTKEIIFSQEKEINLNKYTSQVTFDYPINNKQINDELYVEGWIMSENKNPKIQLLLDGKDYSDKIQRTERQDVLNAVKNEYGGKESNPLPGFEANIDVSDIKDGNHQVTLIVSSPLTGEIINKQQKNITIHKYNSTMTWDYPKQNENEKQNLYIEGWVMSDNKDEKVILTIDGKDYSDQIKRVEREDVLNSVKGYGGKEKNPLPGFEANIDLKNIKDGKHTVQIKVISPKTNEILETASKTINIKKYVGTMNIEAPTKNMVMSDNLYIEGWEMSDCLSSNIKVLIDNKAINVTINRKERNDVINTIKGYGTIKENPLPGYYLTIPSKQIGEGRHTLTLQIVSDLGDIITQYNKVITVYLNQYWGIDVSEHQGTIDYDALMASKEVDFMIMRAGFGRNPEQIDKQFERNYKEATARKLPIGAYLYSYATDIEGAKAEAYNMLTWLKEKSFNLPIFYDIEDPTQDNIDKETKTDMCIAFCEIIKSAGYKVGIYTNKDRLINQINVDRLPNDYAIWVASYGNNTGEIPDDIYQYTGNHEIWQYTSKGTVNGINTSVDFNICYKKYF